MLFFTANYNPLNFKSDKKITFYNCVSKYCNLRIEEFTSKENGISTALLKKLVQMCSRQLETYKDTLAVCQGIFVYYKVKSVKELTPRSSQHATCQSVHFQSLTKDPAQKRPLNFSKVCKSQHQYQKTPPSFMIYFFKSAYGRH